jgi:uncharacterized protein (TIGR00369 family)
MASSKEDISRFLSNEFPTSRCVIEAVGGNAATISYPVRTEDLRPGGTVSGPTLMAVADIALYVAILGEIGIVPLTVTTSLNINFLRKPAADKDIVAVCKLIKLGRTLAVGEVSMYSSGLDALIAHAVGTYSIPPRRSS